MYLDTNFFFYVSDTTSSMHDECVVFLEKIKNAGLHAITSVETVQEIVHWSATYRQRRYGLELVQETVSMVDEFKEVKIKTMEIFVTMAKKYQLNHSRDLLHLATCLEHGYKEIVTFDSAFKNFKEIRSFTPAEYVEVFGE